MNCSFRIGEAPPRYRTPSPPRYAVEPISPLEEESLRPYESRQEQGTLYGQDINSGFPEWSSRKPVARHARDERYQTATNKGHGRSRSSIDALATLALATSPDFEPLSIASPTSVLGDLSAQDQSTSIQRPAKRARSEKARSPIFNRADVRPSTSHVLSSQNLEEARLLLDFSQTLFRASSGSGPSETNSPQNDLSSGTAREEPVASDVTDEKRTGTLKGSNTIGFTTTTPDNVGRDIKSVQDEPLVSETATYGQHKNLLAIQGGQSYREAEGADQQPNGYRSVLEGPVEENTGPVIDGVPPASNEAKTRDNTVRAPMKNTSFTQNKHSKAEADESVQAACAQCNLSRITVAGEDQNEATSWISCDGCKRWFHIACAGFKSDREVRSVDKYSCRQCRPHRGPTTYVRKSTRARTDIDYAGLNQGVVKSSEENPEHHYIAPIKDGRIQFQPENFARMPPELVTASFLELTGGWREPIVIPASLNTPANNIGVADSAPNPENEGDDIPLNGELVPDVGQDQLDMVIPRNLTVRHVAELYGPLEPVEVIDVKSQQGENKKWNMSRWVDYYESEGSKIVRNVISLEVSQSKLGKLIQRPKIVRDLDLQDSVWPHELQAVGDHPKVQFYCLMSVADCFTDFHIDFGGSSVYYHILKGKKTFFFIPPKDKHLKKYEEWCMSPAQDTTFLGDQTKECYRVDLSEGDTMLIPAGWIHAVWTPENSLVIGGNFLTRLNYGMQIKIAKIEKDTKVARKFRYPHFQKVMWYTAIRYMQEDPIPGDILKAFRADEAFEFDREKPLYCCFDEEHPEVEPGTARFNARYYSKSELDGLPELAKYLLRTALIAQEFLTDGITVDVRNAVKRSIPKHFGDPLAIIQEFGIWMAWKRGNEQAPSWVHDQHVPIDKTSEKKPSAKAIKRSERIAAFEAYRIAPERQSARQLSRSHSEVITDPAKKDVVLGPNGVVTTIMNPRKTSSSHLTGVVADDGSHTPKMSILGPKRIACEACRRRRIRCEHKEGQDESDSGNPAASKNASNGVPTVKAERSELPSEQSSDSSKSVHKRKSLPSDSLDANASDGLTTMLSDLSSGVDGSYAKKGRSKACDECRKSKVCCYSQ